MKYDVLVETTIERRLIVEVPSWIEDPETAALEAVELIRDEQHEEDDFYPDLPAPWGLSDRSDEMYAFPVSDAYVTAVKVIRRGDDPQEPSIIIERAS